MYYSISGTINNNNKFIDIFNKNYNIISTEVDDNWYQIDIETDKSVNEVIKFAKKFKKYFDSEQLIIKSLNN